MDYEALFARLQPLIARGARAGLEPLVVKQVANVSEVRKLANLERASYGDAGVSFRELFTWWSSYPRGMQAVWDGDAAAGVVELWPMKRAIYVDFIEGRRGEESMCFDAFDQAPQREFWYFGGMFLVGADRSPVNMLHLLIAAMKNWLQSGDVTPRIQLCAFAVTGMGDRLLRNFGYEKCRDADDTNHGHAAYVLRDLDVAAFLDVLEKLDALRRSPRS
ncbi:MAG: hypothetical protein ACO1PZ_11245 [Gammaproteobacteria bacterium]